MILESSFEAFWSTLTTVYVTLVFGSDLVLEGSQYTIKMKDPGESSPRASIQGSKESMK